jgi:hypothetical protein
VRCRRLKRLQILASVCWPRRRRTVRHDTARDVRFMTCQRAWAHRLSARTQPRTIAVRFFEHRRLAPPLGLSTSTAREHHSSPDSSRNRQVEAPGDVARREKGAGSGPVGPRPGAREVSTRQSGDCPCSRSVPRRLRPGRGSPSGHDERGW